MLLWSTLAAGTGAWLAWAVGVKHRTLLPACLRPLGAWCYRQTAHAYYVDEGYERFILRPCRRLADRLSGFDQRLIDGAVNATGRLGWLAGQWKAAIDRVIVDGAVNGVAATIQRVGSQVRGLQTGIVQQYLLVVVTAVVALALLVRRS